MDKRLEKAIMYAASQMTNERLQQLKNTGDESAEEYTAFDELEDLLEEFGDENRLAEGWWLNYGDIEDIAEMVLSNY